MKGTLFLAGNHLLFFGNPGSKVAWSRWGLSPYPLDSQPDAMAIWHSVPFLWQSGVKDCLEVPAEV